eukprot:m.24467 g.24467  ORF g.24467 m.24467 type:complete len:75 (+) comp8696_c0_seq1:117-341(+)
MLAHSSSSFLLSFLSPSLSFSSASAFDLCLPVARLPLSPHLILPFPTNCLLLFSSLSVFLRVPVFAAVCGREQQ